MQTLKNHRLKDYLTFSARERRAVLLLLSAIILFALLPRLFPFLMKEPSVPTKDSVLEHQFLSATELKDTASGKQKVHFETRMQQTEFAGSSEPGSLFYFDPNTATATQWAQLGVKEKTVQSIFKYVAKGGRFRKPDDLRKVYTLSPSLAEKLIPYVRIAGPASSTTQNLPEPVNPGKQTLSGRSLKIDINRADAATWMQLEGIGPAFAGRIIRFREKLGGFITVEQVQETYGLPDTTFDRVKQYLVAESKSIRRINLNTATVEELNAHPYIDNRTARNIIAYRDQHGAFQQVETLLRIGSIDEVLFQRIAPYLEVK